MRTTSAFVSVRCKGCGNPRTLTRRQARRAGLCNQCLYPPQQPVVQDKHFRFWYDRFTDHELVLLVSDFAELQLGNPWRIAEHRMALTGSAAVASPGERQSPPAVLSPPR